MSFATLLEQGTATPQEFCAAFVTEFPTPQVIRGYRLAIEGRITWQQLYELYGQTLADALAAVK